MVKKIYNYRGHTQEELNAMSMDELVKILPSRARRSLTSGLNEEQKKLLKKVKKAQEALKEGKKEVVKTHCRDTPILPDMVGLDFEIYNGKEFTRVEIKTEMIGQYLGEYSLTRRPVKHSAPGVGATRSSLFVPIK